MDKLLKKLKTAVLCAAITLNIAALSPMSATLYSIDGLTYEIITNGQSRFAVTEELNLSHTVGGESIAWSSSNENVIDADGKVTRPLLEDEKVTLTASFGGETKEFEITVLSALSTVVSSTEFETPDVLANYTVNDQGEATPVEYSGTDKKIDALYSTVTVENNSAMKIVPRGGKMSTINRKDTTGILTGTVVIEKRIDVSDGFDLEIKNSLGKRVIKLQATSSKLMSYSNFNTTDVTLDYRLPNDWFDMKIVADTTARTFSLYIDGETPSKDFKDKAFMAESSAASDIAADKIYFGGYLRTEDKPVLVECESVKTVAKAPEIDEVCDLLTEELIKGENTSLNSVEKDLILKNSYNGLYGAEIEWSVSPDTDVVKTDGTVKRSSEEDKIVTITATVFYNGEEADKNFIVTVKRKPVSAYLTAAAEKLDYSVILADGVSPFALTESSDINLISKLADIADVDISWESSDDDIISAAGSITRAELSDRTVTLTAKLTYNDETVKESFKFVVLAQKSESIYSENFNTENALRNYSLAESGSSYTYDEESKTVQGTYAAITYDNGSAVLTPTDDNQTSYMHRTPDKDALTGIVIIQKRVKISKGFDLEIKNSLGKRVIKLQTTGNKLSSYLNYNTVDKTIDYTLPQNYFDLKIEADTNRKCFTLYIDGEIPGESFQNHPFMAECSEAVNIQPGAIYIGAYPRTSESPIRIDSENVSTASEVLSEEQIKEKLSDVLILGDNKSKDRVTKPLNLKNEYLSIPNAKISWSSDSSAVNSDGTLTRDSLADTVAVITAEISYDGYTYTKEFDITVLSEKSEIQLALADVTEEMLVQGAETSAAVSSDLKLQRVEELFENARISWESSNESVIANDGRVMRPDIVDADVILKATIVIKGITYKKELYFTVKCKDAVYVGTSGNNILLSNIEETKNSSSLSLSLTAKTQGEQRTENMCLAIYAYDKVTGEIKGFDYDEEQISSNGKVLRVSVDSVNTTQVIHKYFVWDSLANHKPLCDLSPSYPGNLSARATAYDAVTLSWENAFDDFSDVEKYRIYSDGVYEGETEEVSFIAGKLDKGQNTVFEVSAVDGNGYESPKSMAAAQTEKMPVCVADGDNIVLPSDSSVRCYVETRIGYYGHTDAGKDENGVGYRVTTSNIRPNTTTTIISRVPFVLSDNFITKNTGEKNFAIEITYFDEGNETMKLIYDDVTSELHGMKSITMTNTRQWKTSTVILNDANFKKSSNSGNSYANIMVYTPSAGLKIHALGIMPIEKFTRDSSGFRVENNMLILRDAAFKTGEMQIEEIGGKAAVKADNNSLEFGSLGINSSQVQIEVYYYDNFEGNILLKYRSEGAATNIISHEAKGTGLWKKAKFTVSDAAFDGGLYGEFMANADFAIETDDDNPLCINTVRILSK